MNIIKSYKEPDKHTIWFNTNDNNFYYFNNGKWRLMNDLESTQKEIQEITWSDLKTLRDTSKLIPGATYRITDYTCTTVQEGTQSAGHVFDILVTADDVNILNENAHAIQHSGDTYFANSDLSAWELKYCLDNDTTRFAWADNSSSGRGVVYYMKDEFNNECPYDFKNIQYNKLKSFTYSQWGSNYSFTRYTSLDEEISGVTYYGYHCSVTPSGWNSQNCFVTDSQITTTSTLYSSAGGSIIPYGGNIVSVNSEETYGIYTFSVNNSGIFKDGSLLSSNSIYGNVILNYINENKLNLNRIWFIGKNIKGNTFGTDCYANTFGTSCYNNTFGNGCYSNTFGNNCYRNNFGNTCYSNTFGNNCGYNTFGNSCYSNTFGNDCDNNTFGNDCYNNTFGNDCDNNTFGNNCGYNTFGNYFQYNTFGNNCTNNTFGNNCGYNTFGNDCDNNTFGNDYIHYCTFFDGVQYINVSITTTNTNNLQNMQVLNGTQGTSSSKLQITGDTYVTAGRNYTTTIGMNSSGTLTSKVLMD